MVSGICWRGETRGVQKLRSEAGTLLLLLDDIVCVMMEKMIFVMMMAAN